MSAFEACGGQLERLEWAHSCRYGASERMSAFADRRPKAAGPLSTTCRRKRETNKGDPGLKQRWGRVFGNSAKQTTSVS